MDSDYCIGEALKAAVAVLPENTVTAFNSDGQFWIYVPRFGGKPEEFADNIRKAVKECCLPDEFGVRSSSNHSLSVTAGISSGFEVPARLMHAAGFALYEAKAKGAGSICCFDPEKYVGDKKAVRHMDRNAQFAVAAAKMAVNDAKLDMANEDPNRVGTIIGTGIGGIKTMEDTVHRIDTRGSAKVNPFAVPMMIANMASGQISITFGLMGPVLADVTACASGNNAIGRATRMIQYGDADVMFAGGTEAAVAKTPMAGFAAMKALSSRDCPPEEASCPFDIRRDGFVLSEGSGVLILEELEHAKNRGAYIYAEVIGYGTNGDAYHITAPRPDGELAARCMQKAIDDAGISPEDIDYINAHGTSTGLNDKNETKAIKKVLGKHAYDIVVNSTKSMTGHLLGAAGAVEAIVCVMSIMNNKVHQTLNLVTPDPECDLDYAPEGPRDMKVDVTMSNAFGFGGHNAVVILRRYEE